MGFPGAGPRGKWTVPCGPFPETRIGFMGICPETRCGHVGCEELWFDGRWGGARPVALSLLIC